MIKEHKFEFIITLLISIFAIIVLTLSFTNRIDKGEGEITISNYTNYIELSIKTNFVMGNNVNQTADISVFGKTNYYEITDLSFSYQINVDNTSSSTFTKTIDKIEYNLNTKLDNISFTFQSDLSFPNLKFELISISGNYKYHG